MFSINPYAELSAFVPSTVMQTYVIIMILCVAGGTLFDIIHKKSAKYFFQNWRKVKSKGDKEVGGGEILKGKAKGADLSFRAGSA